MGTLFKVDTTVLGGVGSTFMSQSGTYESEVKDTDQAVRSVTDGAWIATGADDVYDLWELVKKNADDCVTQLGDLGKFAADAAAVTDETESDLAAGAKG